MSTHLVVFWVHPSCMLPGECHASTMGLVLWSVHEGRLTCASARQHWVPSMRMIESYPVITSLVGCLVINLSLRVRPFRWPTTTEEKHLLWCYHRCTVQCVRGTDPLGLYVWPQQVAPPLRHATGWAQIMSHQSILPEYLTSVSPPVVQCEPPHQHPPLR